MPFTVVCGGFWGDEGKGKLLSYLALKDDLESVVRAGVGTNAGHTIEFEGREYKLRMVPSGFVNPRVRMLIGAGVLVDPNVLFKELKETKTEDRMGVDYQCGIIEQKHIEIDSTDAHLKGKIGSTGSGTGPANMDRAMRSLKLARDIPELQPYLTDVSVEINDSLDEGKNVMAEGSQAILLSLFHGSYPYVTSKDTSAAAICSDVGVGPTRVDEVIVVMKAFLTRVGTGDLPGELSEEETVKRGWTEYGAVTGRLRRAAPFNYDLAKKSVRLNGATQIALTKLDIVFPEISKSNDTDMIKGDVAEFIDKIEEATKIKVAIIGTGPSAEDIIDLRNAI
ncbi:MAG: adenylosuccinate synthetase [Candidatus Heimdallarchaeota archaeon]|nr:adenylosuccinate synthetase [Candidatus Heimdallarchaeota archaeon]MCK5142178.1 adenylosuccinate synthetase [Candidatus Heimdallarchaeota archaeon]